MEELDSQSLAERDDEGQASSPESFSSTGIDDVVVDYDNLMKINSSHHGLNNSSNSTFSGESAQPNEVELDTMKITVLSIIIILTFLGNLVIIIAILARGSKLTRMFYFIMHLSIADLLTAFLTLLPEVAWTLTLPHFYGGVAMCKFIKFTQMLGPYLSSYILIMTAVDRYQAICNPLGSCTWTPRRSQIMISVAWLISFLLCTPQAFIFQGDKCQAKFAPGWGIQAYVAWFSISNFFIPLFILVFCYSRICYEIWQNGKIKRGLKDSKCLKRLRNMSQRASSLFRRRNSSTTGQQVTMTISPGNVMNEDPDAIMAIEKLQQRRQSSSSDSSIESADRPFQRPGANSLQLEMEDSTKKKITLEVPITQQSADSSRASSCSKEVPRTHSTRNISRAKIKTVKLTIVVILAYIVCSAPFVCVQILAVFGSPSKAVLSSMKFLFWLLTLNSVVNPWIYLAFNANLVESLRRLWCGNAPPSGCTDLRPTNGRRHQKKKKASKGTNKATMVTSTHQDKSRSVSPALRSMTLTTTFGTRISGQSSAASSRKSSPPLHDQRTFL